MNRLLLFGVVVVPLGLGSCGAVKSFKDSTATMVAKLPALPRPGMLGDHPKVVKVRPQDLKEMPLGHDRLVAYQRSGAFGFWPMGEVKFEPAALPEPGSEVDGSLLPPLVP